ncbi:hypothetical protein IQ277_34840 [Nostocales cyanobacterium LEGE 12452]|nr:hypothetical protein [Nostocales cyanobacterium LEGE 12452]
MEFSCSSPTNLTNVNGTLYFQAYTPTNGYELWKIDPTTGTLVLLISFLVAVVLIPAT